MFGKDSSNNYGYIIPGADTVTPFRGKIKKLYADFTYGRTVAPSLSHSFTENIIYQILPISTSTDNVGFFGSYYKTSIVLSNASILDSYYNPCVYCDPTNMTYYYFIAKSNCTLSWSATENQTNQMVEKVLLIEEY